MYERVERQLWWYIYIYIYKRGERHDEGETQTTK